MGRGMSGGKKRVFQAAAVTGIVVMLVFAVGCSGDLLGYIKALVTQGEYRGIIDLPKTGQTASHATADDGDLEMGVAWPVPRFTDNINGTITDNLTGLMWERVPDGTTRTWTDALTYASGLDLGGHTDWRLPNVNELENLINAESANNHFWLFSQGFEGLDAGRYWSSTTYAPNSDDAWFVVLDRGNVHHDPKEINLYYVLVVRSGQ